MRVVAKAIGSRLARATLLLAGFVALGAGPADAPQNTPPAAQSTSAVAPLPPELTTALQSLKTADEAGRRQVYALIGDKGDARLIPMLKAYRDGSLVVREDKLVFYGPRTAVPGKGQMLPLLDAITGLSVTGGDGQPLYFEKPDLSKAVKPPRSERAPINDLIAALSLFDPDPVVRERSIQDLGERAGRGFIDPTEARRFVDATAAAGAKAKTALSTKSASDVQDEIKPLDALPSDHPADAVLAMPGADATKAAVAALVKLQDGFKDSTDPAAVAAADAVKEALAAGRSYQDRLDQQIKTRDEMAKYLPALDRQLKADGGGRYAAALRESKASLQALLGDEPTRLAAAKTLGEIGTSRAANILRKLTDAADRAGDAKLKAVASAGLKSAESYQSKVKFLQNTFAGLSLGSILVLLALGLSIVFGLMGVINMAHGEFMMVGAFTTFCVSEGFKHLPTAWFNWYPIVAVPAAFLVAGFVGWLCEVLVIRRLYGRPLETLLATWGISLILIQTARVLFADNLSVTPPKWIEGGITVAPDLTLPLNRVYIILYCVICIVAVYFVVNRTKLGLLIRATTQNRDMATALGVSTRRVDALTFAFGAGLAGLAGVVVPLYNKINPGIGQEYVVDSFMVVVVGGVGKLAGVIWSGLGLGFGSKYLESLLANVQSMASSSSVLGRVLVLAAIVVFLQWRPSGLFPPRGRLADA